MSDRTASTGAAAFVAGYSPKSTSYTNPQGSLAAAGMVEYPVPGLVRLTDAGRSVAEVPTPEQRILKPLLRCYPTPYANAYLAEQAGYAEKSTSYNNPRGRLKSLGLIEYPQPGTVAARSILFPECKPSAR